MVYVNENSIIEGLEELYVSRIDGDLFLWEYSLDDENVNLEVDINIKVGENLVVELFVDGVVDIEGGD